MDSTEGIRAYFRILVSHPPEQRFDAHGSDILQIRGTVVDSTTVHPPVVVRFAGLRQNELYRWAAVGKHLAIDGYLEFKTWKRGDQLQQALLITAQNLFPLNDAEPDLRRVGVYARSDERIPVTTQAQSLTPAQRAERMRRALDEA